MYDADYWRVEASRFRELAEQAKDPAQRQELLDLAVVCEEVAETIEAQAPGG